MLVTVSFTHSHTCTDRHRQAGRQIDRQTETDRDRDTDTDRQIGR